MKGKHRSLEGVVTSNAMDKTVVVMVETQKQHPLYGKVIRRRKKFKAHDADRSCQVGDWVRIEECRPLSKDKRWVVLERLERGGRG